MLSTSKLESPSTCPISNPSVAPLPYSDILCNCCYDILHLVLDRIVGDQLVNLELSPVHFSFGYASTLTV